ncbi:MAG TPA: metallophosphoesterase [Prolixibacteraceae bacterium]|nr:metallophosphoesterase [Prolixibacteraceae bacterium]
MYDIIGDIHGYHSLLLKMLKKMGYEKKGLSYHHPERKVIFTGDYINRGPQIKDSVRLIRNMVEQGDAQAILGNHELNAILYFTLDKSGKYFYKHLARYKLPMMKTLNEYASEPEEWKETIRWFRTLPFFLDLGTLRIVHGSWNDEHIETILRFMNGEQKIKKSFLKAYIQIPLLNKAVNEIIRGLEFNLPKDLIIKDQKGISRRSFRIRWWESTGRKTFSDLSFGNRFLLPAYTIPPEILPEVRPYPVGLPPVFFGHYCLEKGHLLVQDNLCCVDRCVTRSQTLTAYRWSGEKKLDPGNMVYI